MRIETLILRLKTSTRRIVLHFSKRINLIRYTFSNEYHPLFYTFSSESNINPTKVFWFYNRFSTLQYPSKNKKTYRNPQKSQENHYLCIQQAFCNIPAEMSYHSILVSDSGYSTKGLKRDGTTRICKAMKYNGLQLSLHSVYLSKQRLYRLK